MNRDRVERAAWIIGALGLVGAAVGWGVAPRSFAYGWLAAFIFWIGWPLGSMGLLLVHAITGGFWGTRLRPALTMSLMSLPLAVPAAVPMLIEREVLYPWANPAIAHQFSNIRYLNVGFASGRAVAYLLVWLVLGIAILRALRRQDADLALYRLAPLGLILWLLTVTLGSIDATLSLDPHFNSSIFGMVAAADAVLFACAIAVFLTMLAVPGSERLSSDLAKLLVGLLALWLYLEFVQFLIVWNSDLPIDAPWYVLRATHGWGLVAGIVFILHFLVPFVVLLLSWQRISLRAMLIATGSIIVSEIPRAWWLIIAATGTTVSWVDIFAMMAMGGLGVGLALRGPRLWAAAQLAEHHG
jgi:hypothetical protein